MGIFKTGSYCCVTTRSHGYNKNNSEWIISEIIFLGKIGNMVYTKVIDQFDIMVLKWSLDDIINGNIFKDEVKHIPYRFEAIT